MTGWTCPSCGVNYAPSVTQCRCSVAPVVDDQVRKWIDEFTRPPVPYKTPVLPLLPPYVPTPPAPWVDPWTPPGFPFATLSADTGDEPARSVVTTWIVRPDGTHRRIDVDFASLPDVDLSNVDYLQLVSLGGRQ